MFILYKGEKIELLLK